MQQTITIAIADDHDLMRDAVSLFLKEMGFDVVIQATSAMDLLRQLKETRVLPQVCLLDCNMPGMKGKALSAVLSHDYPWISLASFTANRDVANVMEMIENGCKAYFIKGGSLDELGAGIKQLIQKGYYYTDLIVDSLYDQDEDVYWIDQAYESEERAVVFS